MARGQTQLLQTREWEDFVRCAIVNRTIVLHRCFNTDTSFFLGDTTHAVVSDQFLIPQLQMRSSNLNKIDQVIYPEFNISSNLVVEYAPP